MNNQHANNNNINDYPLNQLYFYLTEGCNLCCRHCWITPKHQAEGRTYASLDFHLFCSIIEQGKALGLKGVKLTGGEPLLHPDIKRIIEHIREEDLRLTIETNGVLCTSELVEEIKQCKEPFVAISLDGADAETHEYIRGVEGCFDATIRGIKILSEAGLKPQVIMSIMNRNKNQMESVVQVAESVGADSVKFNVVQPIERGEKMHEAGDTLTIEELIALGRWVEMELSKKTTLRLHYSHPHAFRPLSRMLGEDGGNCGVCGIFGILGVLSDGSYALCGIGEIVQELIFGHSSKDTLGYIWENTAVLKQLRDGLPEKLKGICGDCIMKDVCLGSCVAQNYYKTKDLLSSFWYCEEARNKGLFPESRLRNQSCIGKYQHL